jgi:16S rRNA (guanine966-N2)-methyltransferase
VARINKSSRRPGATNRVRIIGGEWGGRRLSFPDAQGLRPTADRVRETVFNWLQHELYGRRVLDAFAGSGALGFEAASRHAREVVMLERSRKVMAALEANLSELQAQNVTLECVDALEYLARATLPFDIVFLDPPFGQGMIEPVLRLLNDRELLRDDARIYVEFEASASDLQLPEGWGFVRDKKAGDVRYGLLARTG